MLGFMRLLVIIFICFFHVNFVQSQNTITTSGQNFIPNNLQVFHGDSINFILGSNHNAVEVDSTTYFNNGSSPLLGGFSIGFGQDSTILLDSIKTYYYVCQPHVNFGMKGIIVVLNQPVYGCTDSSACNFDSLATFDDGSCQYNDTTYLTITSCDDFLWDGLLLDSSGNYSNIYTNFYGCDSIVYLDLTIYYSTSSNSIVSTCNSYTWNGITYFSSGQYSRLFSNSNGCDSIANLDLTINFSPSIIVNSSNVSCYEGNDGYIDITVNGGAQPYNFLWSNNETTEDIYNLSSGLYSVVVTDSNLCSTSISELITQPSLIDTLLSLSICSWDNFSVGNSIYNTSGTFQDTLQALNGCDSVVNLNLIVFDSLNSGSILNNQFLCFGDTPLSHYIDVYPSGADGNFSTVWQSSLDTLLWTNISGTNNNNTYQPGPLFQSNYYRVEVSSDFGCGTVYTNFVKDSVFNDLTPAVISSSQDICYDTSPQTLNITQPSEGGGVISSSSYTWEFSLNGFNNWQPILTGTSYSPSSLISDRYYRVRTVSDFGCGPVYSNIIHINVYNPLLPGAIGTSQNICYNSQPDSLSFIVLPSGADGNYTYLWQESQDNTQWTNIPSTDSTIYQPPNLDATRYYRTLVTSDFGCGTVETSSIMVNVYDEFVTGSINITDTICYNTNANSIFTLLPPSGGHTPYSYEWSYSTDSVTWTNIPGNNSSTYNPSLLIDTTYYRVNYISNSGCGELLSNTSQVVVLPIVVAGNILEDQFLCYDSIADPIFMDTISYGGDNNFSYQWEHSTDGIIWNEVLGADTTVYNPGFMNLSTFYRLKVASTYNSNCIDRFSNSIDIHVYNPLASGTISSDQDICYNTLPDSLLFSVLPSGADGNYTYLWQESQDNTQWLNISSTNSTIYQPPVLDSTRYYRTLVTSDFGCGTVETSSIMVDVNAEFNVGLINENDTICYLEDPNQLFFGLAPFGGNFNNSLQYSYQWQSNNTGVWNNIPNASSNTYQPVNLNDSTNYRVSVGSDCKTEFSNVVNIVVNPLPDTTSIIGPLIVCENQLNVNYSILSPNSNYRYEWINSDGQIVGTNESQNLLIDWTTTVENSELGLYIKVYETGCEIYIDTLIEISDDLAPNITQIIQKPNTSILICDDTTSSINYQWGLTNIITGNETIFSDDTLRYNEFDNTIDTITNRYWVETSFDYINGNSCSTRSYFNAPEDPLTTNFINISDINFYPNPTNNYIFWDLFKLDNISICDLKGSKQSISIDFSSKMIDVSNLKPGIYFISCQKEEHFINKKIIIQ